MRCVQRYVPMNVGEIRAVAQQAGFTVCGHPEPYEARILVASRRIAIIASWESYYAV